MQVDFYQLEARPVEQALPRIAERLLDAGARLLVVADDEAMVERLDAALWAYREDAFLPHAIAGRDVDAVQPVLLSPAVDAANGARNIALADGLWRDEALDFDRVFYLFDGETVDGARAAWRALGGREAMERRFWKQDEHGKWSQVG
ncbi:DNA polymerase III subunit chi [Sphingomonas sp. LaA6.9]|uniref:DNA polymerase III subunit chi n=1 Tax=Sphingomonas sp. LaA6.9 TaxID=2919914 RepID=UPI001F4F5E37|nr:DNA polymerase III subunit chi [Sphingomonas sp. LaA6.9]MCJ8159878.1 DNA polymerase III subunit chi [Sphingomonas sp. LaA6.9]